MRNEDKGQLEALARRESERGRGLPRNNQPADNSEWSKERIPNAVQEEEIILGWGVVDANSGAGEAGGSDRRL